MKKYEVIKHYVEITKEGPVTNWVQRIADIAEKVGINMSHINWNNPPYYVASDVYNFAENMGKLDALREAIGAN